MLLSDRLTDSDSKGPKVYAFPSARSRPLKHTPKPKLRLTTDEPEDTPAPLRFNPKAKGDDAQVEHPTDDLSAGVGEAIENAQRKLDDLRKLLFPDQDDDGPRAA